MNQGIPTNYYIKFHKETANRLSVSSGKGVLYSIIPPNKLGQSFSYDGLINLLEDAKKSGEICCYNIDNEGRDVYLYFSCLPPISHKLTAGAELGGSPI